MDLSTVEGGLLELPFQCGICGKDFVSDDLENHMKSHNDEEEQTNKCKGASDNINEETGENTTDGLVESASKKLPEGVAATKGEENDSKESKDKTLVQPEESTQEKQKENDLSHRQVMCGTCDGKFDSLKSLDVHLKLHERDVMVSPTADNRKESTEHLSKSKTKVGKGRGKKPSSDSDKVRAANNLDLHKKDKKETLTIDDDKESTYCLPTIKDKVVKCKGKKKSLDSEIDSLESDLQLHEKVMKETTTKDDSKESTNCLQKTKIKGGKGKDKKQSLDSEKVIPAVDLELSEKDLKRTATEDDVNESSDCLPKTNSKSVRGKAKKSSLDSEKSTPNQKSVGVAKSASKEEKKYTSPHRKKNLQSQGKSGNFSSFQEGKASTETSKLEVPEDKQNSAKSVSIEESKHASLQKKKSSRSRGKTDTLNSNSENKATPEAEGPVELSELPILEQHNVKSAGKEESKPTSQQRKKNSQLEAKVDTLNKSIEDKTAPGTEKPAEPSEALIDKKHIRKSASRKEIKNSSPQRKTNTQSQAKAESLNSCQVGKASSETDKQEELSAIPTDKQGKARLESKAESRHTSPLRRKKSPSQARAAILNSYQEDQTPLETDKLFEVAEAPADQNLMLTGKTENKCSSPRRKRKASPSQANTNSLNNFQEENTSHKTVKPESSQVHTDKQSCAESAKEEKKEHISPQRKKKSRSHMKTDTPEEKTSSVIGNTEEPIQVCTDKQTTEKSASKEERKQTSTYRKKKSQSQAKTCILKGNVEDTVILETGTHVERSEEVPIGEKYNKTPGIGKSMDPSEVLQNKQISAKPAIQEEGNHTSPQSKRKPRVRAKSDTLNKAAEEDIATETGKSEEPLEPDTDKQNTTTSAVQEEGKHTSTPRKRKSRSHMRTDVLDSTPEEKASHEIDKSEEPLEPDTDKQNTTTSAVQEEGKHTSTPRKRKSRSHMRTDVLDSTPEEKASHEIDKPEEPLVSSDKPNDATPASEEVSKQTSQRKRKPRAQAKSDTIKTPEENIPPETEKAEEPLDPPSDKQNNMSANKEGGKQTSPPLKRKSRSHMRAHILNSTPEKKELHETDKPEKPLVLSDKPHDAMSASEEENKHTAQHRKKISTSLAKKETLNSQQEDKASPEADEPIESPKLPKEKQNNSIPFKSDTSLGQSSKAKNNLMNPSKGKQSQRSVTPISDRELLKLHSIQSSIVKLHRVSTDMEDNSKNDRESEGTGKDDGYLTVWTETPHADQISKKDQLSGVRARKCEAPPKDLCDKKNKPEEDKTDHEAEERSGESIEVEHEAEPEESKLAKDDRPSKKTSNETPKSRVNKNKCKQPVTTKSNNKSVKNRNVKASTEKCVESKPREKILLNSGPSEETDDTFTSNVNNKTDIGSDMANISMFTDKGSEKLSDKTKQIENPFKSIKSLENQYNSVCFGIGRTVKTVKDPTEIPQDEIEQTLFALGLGTSLPISTSDSNTQSQRSKSGSNTRSFGRSKSPQPSTSKGRMSGQKRTARKSMKDQSLIDRYNLKEPKVQLRSLTKIEMALMNNPHSPFGKQSWLKHKFDLDSESDDDWEIDLPIDERLISVNATNSFGLDTSASISNLKQTSSSGNSIVINETSARKVNTSSDEDLMKKYGLSDVSVVVKRKPSYKTEVLHDRNVPSAISHPKVKITEDQVEKAANAITADITGPKKRGRPRKIQNVNSVSVIMTLDMCKIPDESEGEKAHHNVTDKQVRSNVKSRSNKGDADEKHEDKSETLSHIESDKSKLQNEVALQDDARVLSKGKGEQETSGIREQVERKRRRGRSKTLDNEFQDHSVATENSKEEKTVHKTDKNISKICAQQEVSETLETDAILQVISVEKSSEEKDVAPRGRRRGRKSKQSKSDKENTDQTNTDTVIIQTEVGTIETNYAIDYQNMCKIHMQQKVGSDSVADTDISDKADKKRKFSGKMIPKDAKKRKTCSGHEDTEDRITGPDPVAVEEKLQLTNVDLTNEEKSDTDEQNVSNCNPGKEEDMHKKRPISCRMHQNRKSRKSAYMENSGIRNDTADNPTDVSDSQDDNLEKNDDSKRKTDSKSNLNMDSSPGNDNTKTRTRRGRKKGSNFPKDRSTGLIKDKFENNSELNITQQCTNDKEINDTDSASGQNSLNMEKNLNPGNGKITVPDESIKSLDDHSSEESQTEITSLTPVNDEPDKIMDEKMDKETSGKGGYIAKKKVKSFLKDQDTLDKLNTSDSTSSSENLKVDNITQSSETDNETHKLETLETTDQSHVTCSQSNIGSASKSANWRRGRKKGSKSNKQAINELTQTKQSAASKREQGANSEKETSISESTPNTASCLKESAKDKVDKTSETFSANQFQDEKDKCMFESNESVPEKDSNTNKIKMKSGRGRGRRKTKIEDTTQNALDLSNVVSSEESQENSVQYNSEINNEASQQDVVEAVNSQEEISQRKKMFEDSVPNESREHPELSNTLGNNFDPVTKNPYNKDNETGNKKVIFGRGRKKKTKSRTHAENERGNEEGLCLEKETTVPVSDTMSNSGNFNDTHDKTLESDMTNQFPDGKATSVPEIVDVAMENNGKKGKSRRGRKKTKTKGPAQNAPSDPVAPSEELQIDNLKSNNEKEDETSQINVDNLPESVILESVTEVTGIHEISKGSEHTGILENNFDPVSISPKQKENETGSGKQLENESKQEMDINNREVSNEGSKPEVEALHDIVSNSEEYGQNSLEKLSEVMTLKNFADGKETLVLKHGDKITEKTSYTNKKKAKSGRGRKKAKKEVLTQNDLDSSNAAFHSDLPLTDLQVDNITRNPEKNVETTQMDDETKPLNEPTGKNSVVEVSATHDVGELFEGMGKSEYNCDPDSKSIEEQDSETGKNEMDPGIGRKKISKYTKQPENEKELEMDASARSDNSVHVVSNLDNETVGRPPEADTSNQLPVSNVSLIPKSVSTFNETESNSNIRVLKSERGRKLKSERGRKKSSKVSAQCISDLSNASPNSVPLSSELQGEIFKQNFNKEGHVEDGQTLEEPLQIGSMRGKSEAHTTDTLSQCMSTFENLEDSGLISISPNEKTNEAVKRKGPGRGRKKRSKSGQSHEMDICSRIDSKECLNTEVKFPEITCDNLTNSEDLNKDPVEKTYETATANQLPDVKDKSVAEPVKESNIDKRKAKSRRGRKKLKKEDPVCNGSDLSNLPFHIASPSEEVHISNVNHNILKEDDNSIKNCQENDGTKAMQSTNSNQYSDALSKTTNEKENKKHVTGCCDEQNETFFETPCNQSDTQKSANSWGQQKVSKRNGGIKPQEISDVSEQKENVQTSEDKEMLEETCVSCNGSESTTALQSIRDDVKPVSEEQNQSDVQEKSINSGHCPGDFSFKAVSENSEMVQPSNLINASFSDVSPPGLSQVQNTPVRKRGKSRRGRRKGSRRDSHVQEKSKHSDEASVSVVNVIESSVKNDTQINNMSTIQTNEIPPDKTKSLCISGDMKKKDTRMGRSKRAGDICLSHEQTVEILVENSDTVTYRNVSDCFHVGQQWSDEILHLPEKGNEATVQNAQAKDSMRSAEMCESNFATEEHMTEQNNSQALPVIENFVEQRQHGKENVNMVERQQKANISMGIKLTVSAIVHREDNPHECVAKMGTNIALPKDNIDVHFDKVEDSIDKTTTSSDSIPRLEEGTSSNSETDVDKRSQQTMDWPSDIVLAFTPLEENLRGKRYSGHRKHKRKLSKERSENYLNDSANEVSLFKELENRVDSKDMSDSTRPTTGTEPTPSEIMCSKTSRNSGELNNDCVESSTYIAKHGNDLCNQKLVLKKKGRNGWKASTVESSSLNTDDAETVSCASFSDKNRSCPKAIRDQEKSVKEIKVEGESLPLMSGSDTVNSGKDEGSERPVSIEERKQLEECKMKDLKVGGKKRKFCQEEGAGQKSLSVEIESFSKQADQNSALKKKCRKQEDVNKNNRSEEARYTVETDKSRENVIIMRRMSDKTLPDDNNTDVNFDVLQAKINKVDELYNKNEKEENVCSEHGTIAYSSSLEQQTDIPEIPNSLEIVDIQGNTDNCLHSKQRKKGHPKHCNLTTTSMSTHTAEKHVSESPGELTDLQNNTNSFKGKPKQRRGRRKQSNFTNTTKFNPENMATLEDVNTVVVLNEGGNLIKKSSLNKSKIMKDTLIETENTVNDVYTALSKETNMIHNEGDIRIGEMENSQDKLDGLDDEKVVNSSHSTECPIESVKKSDTLEESIDMQNNTDNHLIAHRRKRGKETKRGKQNCLTKTLNPEKTKIIEDSYSVKLSSDSDNEAKLIETVDLMKDSAVDQNDTINRNMLRLDDPVDDEVVTSTGSANIEVRAQCHIEIVNELERLGESANLKDKIDNCLKPKPKRRAGRPKKSRLHKASVRKLYPEYNENKDTLKCASIVIASNEGDNFNKIQNSPDRLDFFGMGREVTRTDLKITEDMQQCNTEKLNLSDNLGETVKVQDNTGKVLKSKPKRGRGRPKRHSLSETSILNPEIEDTLEDTNTVKVLTFDDAYMVNVLNEDNNLNKQTSLNKNENHMEETLNENDNLKKDDENCTDDITDSKAIEDGTQYPTENVNESKRLGESVDLQDNSENCLKAKPKRGRGRPKRNSVRETYVNVLNCESTDTLEDTNMVLNKGDSCNEGSSLNEIEILRKDTLHETCNLGTDDEKFKDNANCGNNLVGPNGLGDDKAVISTDSKAVEDLAHCPIGRVSGSAWLGESVDVLDNTVNRLKVKPRKRRGRPKQRKLSKSSVRTLMSEIDSFNKEAEMSEMDSFTKESAHDKHDPSNAESTARRGIYGDQTVIISTDSGMNSNLTQGSSKSGNELDKTEQSGNDLKNAESMEISDLVGSSNNDINGESQCLKNLQIISESKLEKSDYENIGKGRKRKTLCEKTTPCKFAKTVASESVKDRGRPKIVVGKSVDSEVLTSPVEKGGRPESLQRQEHNLQTALTVETCKLDSSKYADLISKSQNLKVVIVALSQREIAKYSSRDVSSNIKENSGALPEETLEDKISAGKDSVSDTCEVKDTNLEEILLRDPDQRTGAEPDETSKDDIDISICASIDDLQDEHNYDEADSVIKQSECITQVCKIEDTSDTICDQNNESDLLPLEHLEIVETADSEKHLLFFETSGKIEDISIGIDDELAEYCEEREESVERNIVLNEVSDLLQSDEVDGNMLVEKPDIDLDTPKTNSAFSKEGSVEGTCPDVSQISSNVNNISYRLQQVCGRITSDKVDGFEIRSLSDRTLDAESNEVTDV